MQGIVPQSVPLSYSSVPGFAMLPAPQIAGLLPAPQITVEKIKQPQRRFRAHSQAPVFCSFAEWRSADDELAAWFESACRRLDAVRQNTKATVYYV
jgi:hypothetical protein